GGLLRKAYLHVNQAFQPFRKPGNRSFQIHFARPVSEPNAAARLRASGGYTDTTPSPQALNDSFTNYLNERESFIALNVDQPAAI
ncbi:hypothetical protein, partial [Brevundimonas sp. UBA7506]|uniref:hypothetical protein n=1 Tax=Brevundimonas sp. UBA7506 TaxID=1946136 RepID=UPI0025BEBAFE